ncbi:MAG: hypothetical protein ABFS19_08140 [Thermodesulfobacteriota bacterium]
MFFPVKRLLRLAAVFSALSLPLGGCGFMTPESPLPQTAPFIESSTFSDELYNLGVMSVIYNAPLTKIQSAFVLDNTGAWRPLSTGSEIQRDITEIVKSTLNAMGGRVIFIEYDPTYVSNQVSTGYSNFSKKIAPDIVITGGITGFDRALETTGEGLDTGIDLQFPDIQSDGGDIILPPSQILAATYDSSSKQGLAKITLDFNMKNFTTLAGVPYMTTSQSMLVHKNMADKSFALTLFGPTFGVNGSTKKVQGRHQAVRVLVQSSMMHLVGRYMTLPYWRLLDNVKPDRIVLQRLKTSYNLLSEFDRIVKIQTWLILHGYNSNLNGKIDKSTITALTDYSTKQKITFDPVKPEISYELFQSLYTEIPLDENALSRRIALTRLLAGNSTAKKE